METSKLVAAAATLRQVEADVASVVGSIAGLAPRIWQDDAAAAYALRQRELRALAGGVHDSVGDAVRAVEASIREAAGLSGGQG